MFISIISYNINIGNVNRLEHFLNLNKKKEIFALRLNPDWSHGGRFTLIANYQIFSGLLFSPPEFLLKVTMISFDSQTSLFSSYLTALVIESFLLLTTMQTSSPFLECSPESLRH